MDKILHITNTLIIIYDDDQTNQLQLSCVLNSALQAIQFNNTGSGIGSSGFILGMTMVNSGFKISDNQFTPNSSNSPILV